MVRRAMVGAAALAVIGGVLGGCGQRPTTDGAPAALSGTSSSTAADGLSSSSMTPVTSTTRMITISVRSGQASGEVGRVAVPLGTPVVLSVTSDAADEIHVHGYDLKAEISAGSTASVSFTANIPGVFEVELEGSRMPLTKLEVS
jgi:heme/copper-type cytochrome/quinol oxidase subunit 2